MPGKPAPRTPIERYGVYFASLDPTVGSEVAKTRPVVVVSRDDMNHYLETVVVCPLTSRLHPRWRTRLALVCDGRDTEIMVDQIRTISRQRLGPRVDRLDAETASDLRALISEMYGT
jgi:mRNA interferase MazF